MSETGAVNEPALLEAKLLATGKAITHVEKKGKNDFHKYDYAKAEDVASAVRKALHANGVTFSSSVERVEVVDGLTTVFLDLSFADADTGYVTYRAWAGTGKDSGDKALYKAYTGGLKTFLIQQFLIPTGEDPEADVETDKPKKAAKLKAVEDGPLPAGELEKVEAALAALPDGKAQLVLGSVGVDATDDLLVSHLPELRKAVASAKRAA